MILIAGLGNPGAEYARHRHNVGFRIVDAIHDRYGFGPWRARFHAQCAEGRLGPVKCLLLKPMTYMNESGRSVGEAQRFFKLPAEDLIVIHDELDLPPGKLRTKAGGGAGGHNGIRSLNAHVDGDYRRVRVGIGHPGHKDVVHAHVLKDFAKADEAWLEPLIDAIVEHAPLLAEGRDSSFANKVHLALAPQDTDKPAPKPARKADTGTAPEAQKPAEPDTRAGPLAEGLKRIFGRKT